MALVFDNNAYVWEHWRDNLIPVPPYSYWEHEPYWVDAHLHSNAYVLDGFDEQLGGGPLVTAWDVTVDVLSSAILALPPANAAQNLDVKTALHDKRQQVGCLCCSIAPCYVTMVPVKCHTYDISWTWMLSTSCTCTTDIQTCITWHALLFTLHNPIEVKT